MAVKTLFTVLVLVCVATIPAASQAPPPGGDFQPASAACVDQATPSQPQPDVAATPEWSPTFEVGATSSGFWRFLSRENCYDLFGASCYTASPTCPSYPEGKPCSPLRSICYHPITSSIVDVYRCSGS